MGPEEMFLNVLLNLAASALWSMGGIVVRRSEGVDALVRKIQEREEALLPLLEKATLNLAEEIDWQSPSVQTFLKSPEVQAIMRQLYSTSLVEAGKERHEVELREVFAHSLSLHLQLPTNRGQHTAHKLFEALVHICNTTLEVAIDEGVLSAHEAMSAKRHHQLLDEIATIQKRLDALRKQQTPTLTEYLQYEQRYRAQVGQRHSKITPPDLDRAIPRPIDELYVIPDFVLIPTTQGKEPKTIPLKEFRNCIYRAVLLGEPGGGKSTFTFKLCHDLANQYAAALLGGKRVTPIHVTLREYGAAKKDAPCSLLHFIEQRAVADYQLPTPPHGAFEYLLLNGRAIVIFDGLDELLDTHYRKEITADINAFCALYPSTPVLVTSRKVGYEQAPLDSERFDVFHLAPFKEKQSREYAQKWFKLDVTLPHKQREAKAASFMNESESVSDLRANALLLGLMCNIYRGEGYLPRNRPDVYAKCANMLFERWDKHRGLSSDLPVDYHIRPIMMHLAHWIYSDPERQSGVTESALVRPTTEYLLKRQFDDPDEAEHAAGRFVEFCRGRAWVFTDTGTTAEGENLYQFTHRTFLEYFTAAYLVRIRPTPSTLLELVLPKIRRKEWDVVAQLAFQIQSKQAEEYGDTLLSSLLDSVTTDEAGRNILSFAVRCLGFIVPSPDVRKRIIPIGIDGLARGNGGKGGKGRAQEGKVCQRT